MKILIVSPIVSIEDEEEPTGDELISESTVEFRTRVCDVGDHPPAAASKLAVNCGLSKNKISAIETWLADGTDGDALILPAASLQDGSTLLLVRMPEGAEILRLKFVETVVVSAELVPGDLSTGTRKGRSSKKR